jgi:hypothetical protein
MSTTTPHDRAATGGRHPVHVAHLVMGLAFLGIVVVWALVQADLVGGDDVRWLLPVPWVLAGGAGLLATTVSARRRREAAAAQDPYGYDPDAYDPVAYDPNGTDPSQTDTEEIR